MDFELTSQPQLVKDFFYTTRDFLDFVRSTKKRSLDVVEKKIILQRKLWGFKKVANDLRLDTQLPSETLAQAIFYSIPIYNDILNELSSYRNPEFDLFWMEAYGLMNELTCALANIRSKGNLWNYQATANLLVKILLGLPRYDTAPDPAPVNDRDLTLKYIAQINSITSTSAVYTNAIVALTNIPLQELRNWATSAFWHFNLQFEAYKKIYPIFPQLLVRNDWNQITYNFLFFHTTLDPVRILTINLQTKFGAYWDSMIQSFGVLPENSLKGIEFLIERLQANVENTLEIIYNTYKDGFLSINTDPNNNINIINMMNLKIFYIYNKCYLKLLEFLFFHNEDTDKSLYEKQFYEFLEKSYEYSKILETTAGGKEQIFKSSVKSEYIDIIAQRIEILALYAKHEHSLKTFNTEIKDFQWLIEAKQYELFPDFYLKYYLINITLFIEYSEISNMQVILEKLLELREELACRPRDYIAISILITILDYIYNSNTNRLEQFMDEARNKGISEGGQFHLEEKFNYYYNYLKNILRRSENFDNRTLTDNNYDLLTVYSSEDLIPLDSMTWLIPKFKKINSSDKEETIIYIPFNRAKDAII